MEPQRRDLAYNAYLQEHPSGNFTRFSQLSQAGKRSYGDPTALALPVAATGALSGGLQPLASVGLPPAPPRRDPRSSADHASLTELRRKIAWAVGSVYKIQYIQYDTWPADYARLAAERLIEIHGPP